MIKSIKNWWENRRKNQKIIIVFFLVILGVVGLYLIFCPKTTFLELKEPTIVKSNGGVGWCAYGYETIDSTTNQISIKGKTEPNANITAYVMFTDVSLASNTTTEIKSSGKPIKVSFDNKTSEFTFIIETNPNYDSFHSGETIIYIEAIAPNKEINCLVLKLSKSGSYTTTSTDTNSKGSSSSSTSSSYSTPKYETYEYWYGIGKGDGIVGRPKDYSIINSKWGDAYLAGYAEGYPQYERVNNAFN